MLLYTAAAAIRSAAGLTRRAAGARGAWRGLAHLLLAEAAGGSLQRLLGALDDDAFADTAMHLRI